MTYEVVATCRVAGGSFQPDRLWNETCTFMAMVPTSQRDPETYRIIGAAMAVHRELGHGFLEAVYREALPIEFERRKIPYRPEVVLPIRYQGIQLPTHYKADFICESGVIVEVKALDSISSHHEAQLLNYLKASGIRRGLVINFGAATLEYKRRVWGWA